MGKRTFVNPERPEGHCPKCGIFDYLIDGLCVTHWCLKMDEREGITRRYLLSDDDTPEHEVTKEEWVAAERRAGFYNTLGHDEEPATGGFGTSRLRNLKGRVEVTVAPGRVDARAERDG